MRTVLALAALSLLVACTPPTRGDDGPDDPNKPVTTPDAGTVTDACGGCPSGATCRDGSCVGTTPTGCLDAANCVSNNDCASGSRCNSALSPPRCEKLYCAASGATCSDDFFCQSGLECLDELCAPPPPPVGTSVVHGKVAGLALIPKDTIATTIAELEAGLAVIISDVKPSCGAFIPASPASSTSLRIVIIQPKAGTFAVDDSFAMTTASVAFNAWDAGCRTRIPTGMSTAQAVSGTVVLATYDATTSAATGTFDVTFASHDRVTGSFVATGCATPVIAANLGACSGGSP